MQSTPIHNIILWHLSLPSPSRCLDLNSWLPVSPVSTLLSYISPQPYWVSLLLIICCAYIIFEKHTYEGVRDRVQLVEYLPSIHEAPSLINVIPALGRCTHHSLGLSEVHPQLWREFKAIWPPGTLSKGEMLRLFSLHLNWAVLDLLSLCVCYVLDNGPSSGMACCFSNIFQSVAYLFFC